MFLLTGHGLSSVWSQSAVGSALRSSIVGIGLGIGVGRDGVILYVRIVLPTLFAVGLSAGTAGGDLFLATLKLFLLPLFLGPVTLGPLLVVVRFESHSGSPLGRSRRGIGPAYGRC
ncbi:membrane protein of unknown function (plasmid) [Azospirillum lipoferum 4B]|uniref:Uncharacterized protein n=1 Tax=Azospirillum lipoferum (strain 4B) TaxID=862719 RepID=G7ZG82_AZOL4|nr:membrane protein of unknown function [Azospirillum lipoferum 4B]